ncbi:MAG: sulfatase family protein, partial [Planctomycetota bacterium]
SAAQESPNIVIILADDFGYRSADCYGADVRHIRTPNIDQLAEDGMRFLNAYTPGSVCTPTRYALLTGRYAWRGLLKYGVLSPPEGPLLIEPELLTLPEYLKQHGYRTAHIGKWHLGYTNLENVEDLSAQPLAPGPRSMGFDYHFAVPNQIDWLPKVYVENESIWGLRSKGRHPYGKSFYKGQPYHGYDAPQRVAKNVTQDLSDAARRWISKTVKEEPGTPFFLYFAPVAVHHPISPSDKMRGTSGVGPYGDFIHDLDHSVGEVVDALAYAGVLEDTIVIFTSDNGGDFCPEEQQARDKGFKNNGDLRGDKHTIWEGGFKVPFVVRWPKAIKKGRESDRMINLVDIYATLQEIVGGKVLDAKTAAADSFSFRLGRASEKSGRKTMVLNDVRGVVAIRMNEWKYIEGKAERPADKARQEKNPNLARPQLYNLTRDPVEGKNVINEFPEIAKEMQKALDRIRSEGSERLATKGLGK